MVQVSQGVARGKRRPPPDLCSPLSLKETSAIRRSLQWAPIGSLHGRSSETQGSPYANRSLCEEILQFCYIMPMKRYHVSAKTNEFFLKSFFFLDEYFSI